MRRRNLNTDRDRTSRNKRVVCSRCGFSGCMTGRDSQSTRGSHVGSGIRIDVTATPQ